MSARNARRLVVGLLLSISWTCAQAEDAGWSFRAEYPDYVVSVPGHFLSYVHMATERGPGVQFTDEIQANGEPRLHRLPSFEVSPRRDLPLAAAVAISVDDLVFSETGNALSRASLQGWLVADGRVIGAIDHALTKTTVIDNAGFRAGFLSLETDSFLIQSFRHLSVTGLQLSFDPGNDASAIFSINSTALTLSIQVAEVPEPASPLMLAAGLGLIGWRRRVLDRVA